MVHGVLPWVGHWLIRCAGLIVDAGMPTLLWVSSQQWATLEVAAPTPVTVVGWGLLVVGLPWALVSGERTRRQWGRRLCLAGCALFAVAAWIPNIDAYRQVVRVTFIDVGQGDAILIQTPRGQAVLIDGGGMPRSEDAGTWDLGERQLVPYLKHEGIKQIDVLVNTHPHEDHLQGLLAVLKQRPVVMVIDSGRTVESHSFAQYRGLITSLDIPYYAVKRGDVIALESGIVLRILGPPQESGQRSLNGDSVVIRLETAHGTVLLTGDLEKAEQQELLWGAKNVELAADVIKVPHHGSGRDVDWRFIDAVSPAVAVIQVGRNAHGHPAAATLAAYTERGAQVLRTDYHGAVTVLLTPRGIRIKTYR